MFGSERRARQRERLVVEWAALHGFTHALGDARLVTAFPGPPFDRGRDQEATSPLRGTWAGRPACAFDYRYSIDDGERGGVPFHVAVAAIELPVALPSLLVAPKTIYRKLWDAFTGGRDVEVADAAFAAKFRVRSSEPRFARELLTPATTAMLLAAGSPPWRTSGSWLVLWQDGRNDPPGLDRRLSLLSAVADGIPPGVLDALDGGSPVLPDQAPPP